MAEKEKRISRADVKTLASKLDGIGLQDDQRLLLSAIVNVGGNVLVGNSAPTLNGAKLEPPFRDQFASSFKPGPPPADDSVLLKIRG